MISKIKKYLIRGLKRQKKMHEVHRILSTPVPKKPIIFKRPKYHCSFFQSTYLKKLRGIMLFRGGSNKSFKILSSVFDSL
jgi:hypothetical protein